MMPRWKLKATRIEGGFALRLVGDGDLGEAVCVPDSVVVEMEDGQTLCLYQALVRLIHSRVTGFDVLMEPLEHEWLH